MRPIGGGVQSAIPVAKDLLAVRGRHPGVLAQRVQLVNKVRFEQAETNGLEPFRGYPRPAIGRQRLPCGTQYIRRIRIDIVLFTKWMDLLHMPLQMKI